MSESIEVESCILHFSSSCFLLAYYFSSFYMKTITSADVELHKSIGPNHTEWEQIQTGILHFKRDFLRNSFFFQLIDDVVIYVKNCIKYMINFYSLYTKE